MSTITETGTANGEQANAAAVATFLARSRAVSAVHYPGLASHPGHALVRV